MFGSVRYKNPVVRQHLASQYAMGLLTPLVKKRVEAFIVHDLSFEKEVRHWQEDLCSLNELPEPVAVPSYVRQKVLDAIVPQAQQNVSEATSWLQMVFTSLRLWQGAYFYQREHSILRTVNT